MDYIPLTGSEVASLWNHLERRLRSRVVKKSSRPLMRIASRIVERRTGMDRDVFMSEYVTTLRKRIFLPDGFDGWTPESQARLAVHEHQHVAQWRDERLRYLVRYARDTGARASYEVEAMVAETIIMRDVFGTTGDNARESLAARIGGLLSHGYGLSHAEVQTAKLEGGVMLLEIATGRRRPPRAARIAYEWAAIRRAELTRPK